MLWNSSSLSSNISQLVILLIFLFALYSGSILFLLEEEACPSNTQMILVGSIVLFKNPNDLKKPTRPPV